ncbi:MAG: hypothetical protein K2R93_15925 [Gemmatimonadaceae bacterium]|nr:hypothetical protein [Gemmatimonadaceae bacterium]
MPLVIVALIALLIPARLSAQVYHFGPRFLYDERVELREDTALVRSFTPVAPWGDLPQTCAAFSPPNVLDFPDYGLHAPRRDGWHAMMFVWFTANGRDVSRAQIVRTAATLPLYRDGNVPIVDPLTPLTDQTIISIDFADSSLTAYNRVQSRPLPGVRLSLRTTGDPPPFVDESLKQIAAAKRLCLARSKA